MSNIICSRCGKSISDEELCFHIRMSNFEGKKEASFWCKPCHDSFIKDMEEEGLELGYEEK